MSPYVFLLPTIILILVFRLIPIGYSFWLSLMRYDIINPVKSVFIGLDNYARMLRDEFLWRSLINTVFFTFGSLTIGLFLSLVISFVICEAWFKFQGLTRSLLFIPFIMSVVVSGLIWSYIFQIDFGLLNSILRVLGLPGQQLMASRSTAMWAVIIVTVWRELGYRITIWSAGILSASYELIEAARIDGANRLEEILYIRLPLLKPVALFLVVLGIINSFQVFDLVYIMAGPARSTEVAVYYLWNTAFRDHNIGYSAAISWLLFAILITFTLLQVKIFKTEEAN